MKEYVFDISKIHSLNDWWDMYSDVVNGEGIELFGRNRDAYRDSLFGGPGCPRYPCRFVFINMGESTREDVRKWTVQELELKKTRCHPSWHQFIDMQLELLKYGIGETIYQWILEPVMGHKQIEVIIKSES